MLPFPIRELSDVGTNKGPIIWLRPLKTTFSHSQRGEAIIRRRGQGRSGTFFSFPPFFSFLFFFSFKPICQLPTFECGLKAPMLFKLPGFDIVLFRRSRCLIPKKEQRKSGYFHNGNCPICKASTKNVSTQSN